MKKKVSLKKENAQTTFYFRQSNELNILLNCLTCYVDSHFKTHPPYCLIYSVEEYRKKNFNNVKNRSSVIPGALSRVPINGATDLIADLRKKKEFK